MCYCQRFVFDAANRASFVVSESATTEVDPSRHDWYLMCMRNHHTIPSLLFVLMFLGCAGTQQNAPAERGASGLTIDSEALSIVVNGLSVERPDGWRFLAPDHSVFPDTLVILQGATGSHSMAAVVEIGQRKIAVADQRRPPSHILTALAMEMVQTFAAFDTTGSPEDVTVAGKPGSMFRMTLTEQLPDGGTADRLTRIYGIVDEADIWLVRCLGPTDKSAEADFDKIVASLKIGD